MKAIILAAGLGSRLGKPYPKPLTPLSNGSSIMQQQLDGLLPYIGLDDIWVVVGFKKELVMEAFPELTYVYNDRFDTTNTSKSLLKGMRKLAGHDVLWMNGDVVFEPQVIERVISFPHSCMAVNKDAVGEEEVKYRTDGNGRIVEVSKQVKQANGEAVGINRARADDLPLLLQKLEACDDGDYFEKAIEWALPEGFAVYPVDVTELVCTEVDFEEDLKKANEELLHKMAGRRVTPSGE